MSRNLNMRRGLWLLPVIALCLISGCGQPPPEVRKTTGKNAAWITNHLNTLLHEISRDTDGKILLLMAGPLSPAADNNRPNPLKLGVGETFVQPDHHGSRTFTVKEITDSGVVIGYEDEFSHLSFGKNLITIDEGTVTLPHKKSR